MDIKKDVEKFLEYLQNSTRMMPNSIGTYRRELKILSRLIARENDLDRHLTSKSSATHYRKVVMWQKFAAHAPDSVKAKLMALKGPDKVVHKMPRFLTKEEVEKVRAGLRTPRERLLVELSLSCGLRIGESLGLRHENFIEGRWLKITRKGGREQRLPITEEIANLEEVLRLQRKPQSFVFLNEQLGQKVIGARQAYEIITRIGIRTLGAPLNPHALRHTFASTLIERGASIRALQEFLGHRSYSTTERYIHLSPEHLRETQDLLRGYTGFSPLIKKEGN